MGLCQVAPWVALCVPEARLPAAPVGTLLKSQSLWLGLVQEAQGPGPGPGEWSRRDGIRRLWGGLAAWGGSIWHWPLSPRSPPRT